MDSAQPLLVVVVFLIAGAVKGVSGMGLPTAAMSLLGLCMTQLNAAAIRWWSGTAALTVFVALAGAVAGLKLGEILRGRLAGTAFRRSLFLVFIALGLANLTRSV